MLLSRMDRHVLASAFLASLMTLLVLLAITLALFLAELLADVGQGQAAAGQVIQLLGLRIPEALLLIAPLALMLGLMLALGQMTQQHELGIFRSSGLAAGRLMKPVVLLAMAWVLGLLLISGWLAPWAERQSQSIHQELAEQLLVASVKPGQFNVIGNDGFSVYVERMDPDTAALENLFIYLPTEAGVEVVTASQGALQFDSVRGQRMLSLFDGVHVRHDASLPSGLSRIEFERNDIFLPQPTAAITMRDIDGMSLPTLFEQPLVDGLAERHERYAPAVIAIVFMLIVLPVTLERPRANRYGIVLLGLLSYLLYSNAIQIALGQFEQSVFLARFGLWPMHALALLLAFGLWLNWYRRW